MDRAQPQRLPLLDEQEERLPRAEPAGGGLERGAQRSLLIAVVRQDGEELVHGPEELGVVPALRPGQGDRHGFHTVSEARSALSIDGDPPAIHFMCHPEEVSPPPGARSFHRLDVPDGRLKFGTLGLPQGLRNETSPAASARRHALISRTYGRPLRWPGLCTRHRHMSHPEPQQLERFMRGESPGDERRLIVRHLLTGCLECAAITREIWDFADHPLRVPAATSNPRREQTLPSGRSARARWSRSGTDRAARPAGLHRWSGRLISS